MVHGRSCANTVEALRPMWCYDMGELLRKLASGMVFWLGLGCIAVLAIPAAVLWGLIALVWTGMNGLDRLIQRKKQ